MPKRARARRPVGRPRKDLLAAQLRQVELLAGYGLTDAAIAAVLGMSASTFRERKQEERISGALEKGRGKAQLQVAKALFRRACKGELGAIVWWEKTRAGYRDNIRLEHGLEDTGVLVIPAPLDSATWLGAAAKQQAQLPGK